MKPGKMRFFVQIEKIEKLVSQASIHENKGHWLFLQDLRTPFFMLEGLSKIYSSLYDEVIFDKLKDKFKSVEDALGAIDYFASFQKEFAMENKLPEPIMEYFMQKTNEKVADLNNLLEKNGWLDGKEFQKIAKKLEEIKWKEEAVEKLLLTKYYKKQVVKINEFVVEAGLPFDNIEEDVHELRRRIRWLSIFPQALIGAMVFKEIKPVPNHLLKYLTVEIVNSPFNKFPVSADQTERVQINKNMFLSLSWLIAELGNNKDKGLKINALKNAFQEKMQINDSLAYHEAYKYLGKNYPKLEEILDKVSAISKTFFEENNLDFVIES